MNLIAPALAFVTSFAIAAEDIIVADFEGADYGAWKTTGEAFGAGPAHGTLPRQMAVTGFAGKGLANSFVGGDGSLGTLTSPEFSISRKYIRFLIGGGGHPGKTCMNLLVDGAVVRTAAGPNVDPGGSEQLGPGGWDVRDLAGKNARIQIVDNATGTWGHINVDQIVLTDEKPPIEAANVSRDITLSKRYLNLPVKTGAPKRRMAVLWNGTTLREFDIELAEGEPDFWVVLDVNEWSGKSVAVRLARGLEDSRGLAAITNDDALKGAAQLYREPLRPQLHFSAKRGWINDPNGLVYENGEYHLFFQHNPYSVRDGQKHWGHAVSRDLIHWQELQTAIYPHRYGDDVWSGSAVVDRTNSSGWGKPDAPPLVAAFTSTGRGECIVYSNDHGRTFQEFDGNPILKHKGRDPRLVWDMLRKNWILAVYDEAEGKRWIAFYTSPDLKTWTYESRVEGFFECPDFFPLNIDGDKLQARWILTAASSEYMVGTWDGHTFQPETPKLPGHRGRGFYAAQTFSMEPRVRRIQIGWGQMPSPGMPFDQMMCWPTELHLYSTPAGPRLHWQPIEPPQSMERIAHTITQRTYTAGATPLADLRVPLPDIAVNLRVFGKNEVTLTVHGIPITYDSEAEEIRCQGVRASLPAERNIVRLRVIADRTSLEIFGNDGELYMPIPILPKPDDQSLSLTFTGDSLTVNSLTVRELESIWPDPAPPSGAPKEQAPIQLLR
jgi:fructan beta-fructosidase